MPQKTKKNNQPNKQKLSNHTNHAFRIKGEFYTKDVIMYLTIAFYTTQFGVKSLARCCDHLNQNYMLMNIN